jgi:hypothetical protein
MLNGDAHHSEVEGELRIRPVALSKNGGNIPQETHMGIYIRD